MDHNCNTIDLPPSNVGSLSVLQSCTCAIAQLSGCRGICRSDQGHTAPAEERQQPPPGPVPCGDPPWDPKRIDPPNRGDNGGKQRKFHGATDATSVDICQTALRHEEISTELNQFVWVFEHFHFDYGELGHHWHAMPDTGRSHHHHHGIPMQSTLDSRE